MIKYSTHGKFRTELCLEQMSKGNIYHTLRYQLLKNTCNFGFSIPTLYNSQNTCAVDFLLIFMIGGTKF